MYVCVGVDCQLYILGMCAVLVVYAGSVSQETSYDYWRYVWNGFK